MHARAAGDAAITQNLHTDKHEPAHSVPQWLAGVQGIEYMLLCFQPGGSGLRAVTRTWCTRLHALGPWPQSCPDWPTFYIHVHTLRPMRRDGCAVSVSCMHVAQHPACCPLSTPLGHPAVDSEHPPFRACTGRLGVGPLHCHAHVICCASAGKQGSERERTVLWVSNQHHIQSGGANKEGSGRGW